MVCHGYIGCRLSKLGIVKQAASKIVITGGKTDIVEWNPGDYGLLIYYDTTQGSPTPEEIIEKLKEMGIPFTQIDHWPIWHPGPRP